MIKGLENLEIIKSIQTNNYDRRINDYTSVNEEYEYEIEIIEKELKALEIIKNKRADLCILTDCDNFNEYNKSLGNLRPVEDRLTYEEFDLLKEVFCND